MYKKLWSVFTFIAVLVFSANAEEPKNLVINGNAAAELNNWANIEKVVAGGPGGAKCFEVTGSKWVNSKDFIQVDTKSEYQFTVWFKSGNNKENLVYAGLLQFDENKRQIFSASVTPLEKTGTVLTAGAKKGETLAKFKFVHLDASKWETLLEKKQLAIAFDTDDSGEYKDLPNFNWYAVNNLEKKSDVWEATLVNPLSADFPVETKVRAHYNYGYYMYVFSMKKNLADWTKYSGIIKPVVKSGSPGSTFWPGTKYVQILILANWGQKDGESLLFGNINLEKVEPKK